MSILYSSQWRIFKENTTSIDTAPRFRYVRGGFLRQPNYMFVLDLNTLEQEGVATIAQEDDMLLAWAIGSTSNSNTISLVKNLELISNTVGQQDRVGAARLAIRRANASGQPVLDSSAYSDSFFPYPDGPDVLITAGVRAILSSSGSVRDDEVKQLCRERGVTLYLIPDKVGRGFFGH